MPLAPNCPMDGGRGTLVGRFGDEKEYRCESCGHVWTEQEDTDSEFDFGGGW